MNGPVGGLVNNLKIVLLFTSAILTASGSTDTNYFFDLL
jgi:hypothetical protein